MKVNLKGSPGVCLGFKSFYSAKKRAVQETLLPATLKRSKLNCNLPAQLQKRCD